MALPWSLGELCRGMAIFAVIAAGCEREAYAQIADDPLAPVDCFQTVDAKRLSNTSAINLCAGAPNEAPSDCYIGAIDQFHELSEQKILQLCAGASSTQPLECYAQLDAVGTLSEDQIIGFCTTICPVGPPPPEVSSPACVEGATDLTKLSLQQASQLCYGSRSAGPVRCFIAGENLNKLSQDQLIQLCAESIRCQSDGAD
jgi:hypothetical protein